MAPIDWKTRRRTQAVPDTLDRIAKALGITRVAGEHDDALRERIREVAKLAAERPEALVAPDIVEPVATGADAIDALAAPPTKRRPLIMGAFTDEVPVVAPKSGPTITFTPETEGSYMIKTHEGKMKTTEPGKYVWTIKPPTESPELRIEACERCDFELSECVCEAL